MKKILPCLMILFVLTLTLCAQPVLAADVKINSGEITSRGGVEPEVKGNSVVADILNGVYQISAIVAVLMLVIAGIRYITSDGDPSRAQAARKGIIYSLIGLVIIGSAFIITGVVIGLFS